MTHWPAAKKEAFPGGRQNTNISAYSGTEICETFSNWYMLEGNALMEVMYQALKKYIKIVFTDSRTGLLF